MYCRRLGTALQPLSRPVALGKRPDSSRAAVCASVKWGSACTPPPGLLQSRHGAGLLVYTHPFALGSDNLSPGEAPGLRIQKSGHLEDCPQVKPFRRGWVRVGGRLSLQQAHALPARFGVFPISPPGGSGGAAAPSGRDRSAPRTPGSPTLCPAPITEPGQQPCSGHPRSYSRCFWVLSPQTSDLPLHLPTSGSPVRSADRSARQCPG